MHHDPNNRFADQDPRLPATSPTRQELLRATGKRLADRLDATAEMVAHYSRIAESAPDGNDEHTMLIEDLLSIAVREHRAAELALIRFALACQVPSQVEHLDRHCPGSEPGPAGVRIRGRLFVAVPAEDSSSWSEPTLISIEVPDLVEV